jgi:hypothetical protein
MRSVMWLGPAIAAGLLTGCSGVPSLPTLPKELQGMAASQGQFRDLADLPAKPPAPEPALDRKAIESLAEDRARAAQEAENLRQAPFTVPAPVPRSGF